MNNAKIMKLYFALFLFFVFAQTFGQERQFPMVTAYGGIFAIENAAEIPDPSMEYKIVVEVATGSEKPEELNFALNNVARLMNLHAQAGIPKKNIEVVVAVHGEAAYAVMSNEAYRKKYNADNPNLGLLKELKRSGAELYICGQSLFARKIDRATLAPEMNVALSMLTTVTTYQLKGYAFLKF
jgi:intracellular sulfur oxidation DsrE/DsrF family protein